MTRNDVVEFLAAIVAVGAGVYMVVTQSASSDSIFNPLLHGVGAYFIARGLWMFASATRRGRDSTALEKLVELAAMRHNEHAPHEETSIP